MRRLRDDLVDHDDLGEPRVHGGCSVRDRPAGTAPPSAEHQIREVDVGNAEGRRQHARVVRLDRIGRKAVDVAALDSERITQSAGTSADQEGAALTGVDTRPSPTLVDGLVTIVIIIP